MGYWNPKGDLETMVNIFKVGIKEIHSETDKVFIDKFLRGGVSQKTYGNFLAQLYYVYEAMEEEFERNKNHFMVGPIYFPHELNRLENLEQDMKYLHGDNWKENVELLKTTKEYVARIRQIGQDQPELLMSHMFTRYMGDLFGGQILKRKWRKLYNFPEDKGVLFYTFSQIDSVAKFRELIEMRVNCIDMSIEQKYVQLEEMKLVFKYNTDLVLEVLEIARLSPDGFLPEDKVNKKQTWEEELRELSGGGAVSGCIFAASKNSSAQCPVNHSSSTNLTPNSSSSCPIHKITNSSIPKYGLMACATLAVAYPLVKKVWNTQIA